MISLLQMYKENFERDKLLVKKSLSSHGTSLPAEYKKPQNDYIHRGA